MSRFRWSHLFTRKTRPASSRRRTVRPVVEPLEERTLLTAGALDPSFGLNHNGLVTTTVNSASCNAVAIDPSSGKIVVAGSATVNGVGEFAVARYNNIDGTLDTSFGSGGEVFTPIGPVADAFAVAVQNDGKIVAGGFTFDSTGLERFALVRYNSNGSLDNSFGTMGVVNNINFSSIPGAGLGGNEQLNALAVQPDGKIVAAGWASNPGNTARDFALARLNADGTPDNAFGTSGLQFTDIRGTALHSLQNSGVQALVLQGDGKIVAAGFAFNGLKEDFALARYNSNGTLDGSFNTNGTELTDFATGGREGNDGAMAVALSGNDIIAAGFATPDLSTGAQRFALARYNDQGQPDTDFNGTGKVTTQISTQDSANAVVVQADGMIVVGGLSVVRDPSVPNLVHDEFGLARYTANGQLDPGFNPGGSLPGTVTTPFSPTSFASLNGLALQPDGKIVAAGLAAEQTSSAFALARYLATTGTVEISPPAAVTEGQAATITITRSDTSGPASVTFSTSDGTGRAGTDYTPVTQTVTFRNDQLSATVNVPTLDDNTTGDSSKTINLILSNPSGVALGSPSTAVLTITEPLPQESVQLDQAAYTVPVGNGPTQVQVLVDRAGGTGGTVQVPFQVNGSGFNTDFTVVTRSPLVFQPGEAQKAITITVTPNFPVSADAPFTVTLGTPTSPDGSAAVSLGGTAAATVTPLDPEAFVISGPSAVGHNAGTVTYTVGRLGGGPSDGTATVQYTVSGPAIAAGEYQGPTSGTLTIGPGAQGTISLPITNNGQFVGDQALTVTLTSVTLTGSNRLVVGIPSAATTTIRETTVPPPPPHRAVFAELVPVRMGRRNLLMVEVLFADTGAVKTQFLSPLQQPAFHGIQVSTVQENGAGVPDQVILTGRRGRRVISLDIPV